MQSVMAYHMLIKTGYVVSMQQFMRIPTHKCFISNIVNKFEQE
jgi:hypothetical protein